MARRVNGQTYREWRADFLDKQNMTLPLDLETKRRTIYAAIPNGFLPSSDEQRWQWFIKMDSAADQRDGLVYTFGSANGRSAAVEQYVQLSLPDFREACIRRARLAGDDLDRVRDMVIDWNAANPSQQLDIDVFMSEIVDVVRRAAGL